VNDITIALAELLKDKFIMTGLSPALTVPCPAHKERRKVPGTFLLSFSFRNILQMYSFFSRLSEGALFPRHDYG